MDTLELINLKNGYAITNPDIGSVKKVLRDLPDTKEMILIDSDEGAKRYKKGDSITANKLILAKVINKNKKFVYYITPSDTCTNAERWLRKCVWEC